MTGDLVVGFADDSVACGLFAGVFIAVWCGAPTLERLARVVADCDLLTEGSTGELAILAVIEEGSPPAGPREIAFSVRMFDARPRITHSLAVLEGRDPWLASTLDAVAQVAAGRRRAPRTKLCTDVREAAVWLSSRHPHGLSVAAFRDGLLDAIERVRSLAP